MDIRDYIKNNLVYLDGGMGSLLQQRGIAPGELPEMWNITHPDIISDIHRDYFNAGSNIVNTNTFGANPLKFSDAELDSVIASAVECARRGAQLSEGGQPKWVALDVGPTGKMLKPYGDLDFEDAVAAFARVVQLGVKYGVDLLMIETMSDSYETKAALLAAKENSSLPVFVSCAFGEDGKLLTGASPAAMVAMLEGMGADVIGVNCSLGPKHLAPVVREYLDNASVPVMLKPNAGLPRVVNGSTAYDVLPREFALEALELVKDGVRAVGGCCGTTPDYIKELVLATANIPVRSILPKEISCVCSYTHRVVIGEKPLLIGERINPTGKKRFKEALLSGDMEYILREGVSQEERGVHLLDVNVGLPGINECEVLTLAVAMLQSVTDLPLEIDTSDTVAMESALRRYNGKAMINSVSGKAESMRAVFPLVKKYGGVVVALTLDEDGIPRAAEGRLSIARKILKTAAEYGIAKKDIIFDPLALTVSADASAASETLRAVELITHELGCNTILGVSNVSYGLPQRDTVNSAFFTLALGHGLAAAIMNPYSREMMGAYYAYLALSGLDENCSDYILFAKADVPTPEGPKEGGALCKSELEKAIIKGLSDTAAEITRSLLVDKPPLEIVESEIIPALDEVGMGFENKTVYLPQLLMSAEAAKAAFEVIRSAMPGERASDKCNIVLATVKGDIHDIGKNIVKLILENYGFAVTDLGRDVSPEEIVAATKATGAPIVGLSALMTTTVPAMAETVAKLRASCPSCKIIVGGAVLNEDYAREIGADIYAKDAMAGVRAAEKINDGLV